ncbi:hypothetical protein O6H91_14G006400 [Diphasiastrum complanatum]|uniref:Uncharacterized protein n=3 Tax=Diphasiastrum complanatum TaxID=34168 RepID=A0ACC2BL89_DIPCM|nr:hypothetical protein O6H91_14G006400 [Diphasiastrum complanatum]KAJ7530506.1 hypothetical protein O6H91_14G006400 [Diphasiastrum complanatum]KAJ7530507.1 hypothetical protein O6H91_14G006400 [Diphasiastrum complanatum]
MHRIEEIKRNCLEMIHFLVLAMAIVSSAAALSSVVDNQPRTYIVRMDKSAMPGAYSNHLPWYASALAAATGNETPEDSIIHVYDVVFHGFAAKMTPAQAKAMETTPGFISMFPETIRQLHTTHSPEFLHLNSSWGIWPRSHYGSDVIVGMFDTGVWPESKSFSDHRIGPVPRKWKGKCISGPGFDASICNRKLVGARYFFKGYEAFSGPMNETSEYKSPRDSDGHGTHTASTAAGRYVYRASLLGFARGTAVGMAPKARIAAYKVCWASGCFDSDILAAFDQAVTDGVDVISLSVGGGVMPYYLDSIAMGAFGAMEKGVFVACSGGNNGPGDLSVTNIAPWLTTVGASTMDRAFPANVILSDGSIYKGVSLYSGARLGKKLPLIYAGDAALAKNGSDSYSASLCLVGSIDPKLVRGKIVVCDRGNNPRVEKGAVVQAAGGAGMILANAALDGEGMIADCHLLPATAVGAKAGSSIRSFIRASKNPTGSILFYGTKLDVSPAPIVASFSSRGPNPETPEILKPDLIAPGVNILAAWTGAIGPTGLARDPRRVDFNIISGTSMACPHVSGLAALLKGAHPDWSPSAIKSALMTTAYLLDNTAHVMADEATGNLSTPFDFGAGHVDPEKALDPGLIYDLSTQDYIEFLCSLKYSEKAIWMITRQASSCGKASHRTQDFNYPTFAAVFDQHLLQQPSTTFFRTVTNVGQPNSVYRAEVLSPSGVRISVKPRKLVFTRINQKLSFTVTVAASRLSLSPGDSETVFGLLSWTDGRHVVQSPIAITLQEPL